MKRPIGVTVSAVVAIAGSIFALFMAIVLVATGATQPPPAGIPAFRELAFAMGAFVALMGVLGILTGIGVLRLRPWARTSLLVFAAIITCLGCVGWLVIAATPVATLSATAGAAAGPGAVDPAETKAMLLTLYAIPVVVGAWWLVQFNTRRTREAFAAQEAADAGRRPIMVGVIGWFNIIGGVMCLGGAVGDVPAFAMGAVLTGWSASLYYVFLGAVNTFLGWRLLQLDERARVATIWWFVVNIVHTTAIALTPLRDRLVAMQEAMQPEMPPDAMLLDPTRFTVATMLASAALLLGAIWPLLTMKPAFSAESGPDRSRSGDSPPR